MKPSFGYIIGFIFASALSGALVKKSFSAKRVVLSALAGMTADYLIGAPYCIICAHFLGVGNLVNLLLLGNLVYIPKDAVLCVLAAMLYKSVAPVVSGYSVKDKKR